MRRPPSSIPLALVVLVASLVATALAAGDARAGRPPGEPQGAERRDWWPQVESIEPLLREQKWKRALDRAQRLAEEVQRDAWSGRDLDRLMAELAFLQAVAELNSGRPNDAIWHWYAALNLRPEIARRDLTPYANAARLADLGLRRPGEMPSGTQPPGDLDQLRTEPAVFAPAEPPEITANATAALRRQPDVLLEVVVDRQGALRQPVLLSEGAHPVLVYVAFEWLARMPPPRPALLDGRPVDSLELVNVGFAIDRDSGQVFLPDLDN